MKQRFLHAGAALGIAVLLSACGGGGGGDDNRRTSGSNAGLPSSALQSVTGLVTYLNELIGRTDETSEPIALGDAVLPTSDSDAPTPLN